MTWKVHVRVQAEKDGTDLVICDTSGRLHTNIGLMEELAKCKRSISKRLPGAPHEVLLILDGTTGLSLTLQNSGSQMCRHDVTNMALN